MPFPVSAKMFTVDAYLLKKVSKREKPGTGGEGGSTLTQTCGNHAKVFLTIPNASSSFEVVKGEGICQHTLNFRAVDSEGAAQNPQQTQYLTYTDVRT